MSVINILQKTTINRIKIAAPFTVAMLSILFERHIIDHSVAIFSFQWFYSIILFYIITTFIVAALIYNYKLLDHSCNICQSRWSSIQSHIISVSHSIFKMNLITRYFLFRVDKKFKTYTCSVCQKVEYKQSRSFQFIGTTNI